MFLLRRDERSLSLDVSRGGGISRSGLEVDSVEKDVEAPLDEAADQDRQEGPEVLDAP